MKRNNVIKKFKLFCENQGFSDQVDDKSQLYLNNVPQEINSIKDVLKFLIVSVLVIGYGFEEDLEDMGFRPDVEKHYKKLFREAKSFSKNFFKEPSTDNYVDYHPQEINGSTFDKLNEYVFSSKLIFGVNGKCYVSFLFDETPVVYIVDEKDFTEEFNNMIENKGGEYVELEREDQYVITVNMMKWVDNNNIGVITKNDIPTLDKNPLMNT